MIWAAVTVSGYSVVTSMSRFCGDAFGLTQQALGLLDVVAVLVVVGVPEAALGNREFVLRGGAVTGGRHDGVAVDRVGDRLPDPDVAPRLAGLVEGEVPVVVARRDRKLDGVVVLELVDALGGNRIGPVDFTGLQRRQCRRRLGMNRKITPETFGAPPQ